VLRRQHLYLVDLRVVDEQLVGALQQLRRDLAVEVGLSARLVGLLGLRFEPCLKRVLGVGYFVRTEG